MVAAKKTVSYGMVGEVNAGMPLGRPGHSQAALPMVDMTFSFLWRLSSTIITESLGVFTGHSNFLFRFASSFICVSKSAEEDAGEH